MGEGGGVSEGGEEGSVGEGNRTVTAESAKDRRTLNLIQTGINSPSLGPKLADACLMRVH